MGDVVRRADPQLLAAVRRLPNEAWFNVVYRKGVKTPNGQEHLGKAPYQGPYQRRTPEQCAILLEKRPEEFGAVCVVLGTVSGLMCADIDTPEGFRHLEHTYGFGREKPYVTSSKPGNTCFKSFYRVEEGEQEGLNKVDAGNYQFLWHGNIAVILGEYPGSSCGNYAPSVYRLNGDLREAPPAPNWILEEMRGRTTKESSFSRALSRLFGTFCDSQSDEEAEEFIRRQLLYIHPHGTLPERLEGEGNEGGGGRRWWLTVGMAIHHRLPCEAGLALWRQWSRRDLDYEAEWASGAAERYMQTQWASFKREGGRGGRAVTPGTLFWLAEQNDPERKRFPEGERKVIEEVVQKARADAGALRHAELIAALQSIYEAHAENASLITFKVQELAREYGRTVVEIMGLWAAHKQATLQERTGIKSPEDLCGLPGREYLLPGLIQKAAVYVLAGAGGSGKTSFCGALARLVIEGRSIEVKGKHRPVAKGKVLWVSSDTNDVDFRDVLVNAGLMSLDEEGAYAPLWTRGALDYWPGFQWTMISALERRIAKFRPDLVIIDSLASCNRTTGIDENSAAVANPIYDLQQLVLDQPVTFFVLHHLNKGGAVRGSTAIEAACSSVWRMARPSEEQCQANGLDVGTDRIISPGSKNRGVDQKLLCRLDRVRDMFTILEFYERNARAGNTCLDRVVNLIDTSGPHSTASLCDVIGSEYSKTAIEKALVKANQAGLIRRKKGEGRGAPWRYYSLTQGEREEVRRSEETSVVEKDFIRTREVRSTEKTSSSFSVPHTPSSTDENAGPDCDPLVSPYSSSPYARAHEGEQEVIALEPTPLDGASSFDLQFGQGRKGVIDVTVVEEDGGA